MKTESNSSQMESHTEEFSTSQCQNCGAKLKGSYCHECGQKMSNSSHGIKDFLLEYLNNAYMWDPQIFTSLWQLVSKPGYLTKRFLSGNVISHSHPLKLNMFLLFVFITFFVLFHEADNLNDSYYNLSRDESVFAVMQAQFLFENEEYEDRIKNGPRDTVKMRAPLMLEQDYPEIITVLEIEEDNKFQSVDKWIGIIPKVLIEEEILLCDEFGYYYFNQEREEAGDKYGLNIFDKIVSTMLGILTDYFPMIILLTAPLLSFSISLVQRRRKAPMLTHFIFSLHYTAMMELVVILLYVAYLCFGAPMSALQWILILTSNIYLILAFKEVYGISSWYKVILKTFINNVVYMTICCVMLVIIFFVSCYIVAKTY